MAKNEIVMPQMGESITTGTITKWNKNVGDEIEIDEIILEISTDKVESEIPSPFSGRVEELLYEEGETIDVGKVIAIIEDDLSAPASKKDSSSAKKSTSEPEKASEKKAPTKNTQKPTSSTSTKFYTPLVKKMAKEAGIELSQLDHISGSGAAGRVNKSDFEKFMNSGGSNITKAPAAASVSAPKSAPVFKPGESVIIQPMDNMRKAIARNMVQSKLTSPHVNSVDEIDMSHIVKFREGFKNEFFKQEGFKVTYTHFIMHAMILALKEHPLVNASIDGDNIVIKKDINLGCAVAVPGNGLVVPVIKNADGLSLTGLARSLNDLAHRARAKKLGMDDLQGGTFTFTNVGSFGTLFATPVILQPQVGIMAAGVIKKKPIVTADDSIAIRSMMYLTHTYDHRLVDGELGGKFLASVVRNLREMDPKSLF